ncbi:hypothetical protein, conserved [Babesia ovata]|uniref:Uncharacterized protein n=1 Tax=Babesia ovata TaxID=189622 RepID=A0A2H6KJL9_9APIC|nr:uncharacterized protein BOVATA_046620 [Babesia ovata]GBE63169.1 hypothetical protein, conserved [Babesia ovata]
MGDASKRLLSPLKSGMIKFTTELSHAYVNKYSGSKPVEQWEEDETIKVGDKTETKKVLSTEGRNCAKVCLTLMEGLRKDLFDLQNECKSGGKNKWNEKKICLTEMVKTEKVENKLGQWFQNRGFTVPNDDKTQNGELNNERKGENIFGKITENIAAAHSIPVLKTWKDMCVEEQKKKFSISNQKGTATISINTDNIHLFDLADFLRDFFRKYYHVCQHIHIDSPKAPSNIYQMLQWLSGLYFNPMYDKLGEYFKELFDKPKGEEAKPYKDFKDTDLILDATSTIRPKELNHRLQQTCLHSQLVLVAFLGNGYADGRYACEFRTNFDKLLYPSNPSACFDMLVDVLNRVFHQLRFLFIQCSNSRSRGGWANCQYGRYVGGSSWTCNKFQCPDQDCEQKHNQTCNRSGDQMTNQHYDCGLKSPLQSFLEDGLPGFIPHSFQTPGCKLTCTVSNHFGRPCLTPMGFSNLGLEASHTKTGAHLKNALSHLCGSDSHLDMLCSYLTCLLRRAPQTLGDMFAFYYCFLKNWNDKGVKHKKDAFEEAVRKAYFGQTYLLNPTILLDNAVYKQHATFNHATADMSSLTDCDPKSGSGLPCGKYLHPLGLNIRSIFSEKRAANYLSWVVYTTETLLGLLYVLYESCKKCEKPGTRCCNKSCEEKCEVKSTYASDEPSKQLNGQKHTTNCHTIVKCQDMHPTLYQYGFTFGSPYRLSGATNYSKQKRTCKDFCKALQRVLGTESLLIKLIGAIDQFMWKIRETFSITLLTLWSLSLLYLLHITVVRLDVLRIRSHLRSPSSHRIAAQSLLAAARAKALANVKYFSP